MNNELRSITDKMKALGFHWKARNYGSAKFKVEFREVGGRPDPIIQMASDMNLLTATKLCAAKILDFINMVGKDWRTRPIKESEESDGIHTG